MGREWHAAYERANEALQWGNPQITDRLSLLMVGLSLTLDFVIGFERMEDAERVRDVLGKRLGKYGLTLQPDKTRLIPFERPPQAQAKGKGPGTFDLLGFTWYWRRARTGRWVLTSRTRRDRLKRSIQALYRLCRRHRDWPMPEQHADLVRRSEATSTTSVSVGTGRASHLRS